MQPTHGVSRSRSRCGYSTEKKSSSITAEVAILLSEPIMDLDEPVRVSDIKDEDKGNIIEAFCINLDRRRDRWRDIEEEFKSLRNVVLHRSPAGKLFLPLRRGFARDSDRVRLCFDTQWTERHSQRRIGRQMSYGSGARALRRNGCLDSLALPPPHRTFQSSFFPRTHV